MAGNDINNAASSDNLRLAASAEVRVKQIRSEKIATLYRQSPGILVGAWTATFIVILFLWDAVPSSRMIPWLFASILCNTWLALLWWFNRRSPPERRGDLRWGNHFIVCGATAGCVWGATGLVLFVPDSLVHQLLLMTMLFAAIATMLASAAVYIPAFYATALPMLPLFIVRMAMEADVMHIALAMTALVYVLTLTFFARNTYQIYHEALELRFQKDELLQDLRIRTAEVEQASLEKSRFFAAASHDVRQPLQALGLFVDTLEDQIERPDARATLGKIQDSWRTLRDLFDQLLDVSKLDSAAITPKLRGFNVNTLLERMACDYGPYAEQKRLRFRVRPYDACIYSDPTMLERILRNLVVNAVNYTGKGGVLIGCRRRNGCLRIEVWDTGPGIPEQERQKIFREFYQIGNPQRDRTKGLGLGLAIVDRIARLLSHPLEVHSVPGRGSVFRIEVPISQDPVTQETAPASVQVITHNLDGRFMVIVEDDQSVREGMQALCEKWGCRVLACGSEHEALEQLRHEVTPPDAILSDYWLPEGSNGVQTIERIKALFDSEIPAILITGDTAPDSVHRIKSSGHHLLHKPVEPATLRSLLTYVITRDQSKVTPLIQTSRSIHAGS